MAEMTNFLETELFDHVLRGASWTSPTTVYAALFTAAPGEAGGGTEVTGGSYVRKAITFGAPTDGVGSNSAAVTFTQATADWGLITDMAIFDAETAGNMLLYTPLTASKTISNGDTAEFAIGSIVVTFA